MASRVTSNSTPVAETTSLAGMIYFSLSWRQTKMCLLSLLLNYIQYCLFSYYTDCNLYSVVAGNTAAMTPVASIRISSTVTIVTERSTQSGKSLYV